MREQIMKGLTTGNLPGILHAARVEFSSTHLPMLAILALLATVTRLAWVVAVGDVSVVMGAAVGLWLVSLAVWIGGRIDAWEVGYGKE